MKVSRIGLITIIAAASGATANAQIAVKTRVQAQAEVTMSDREACRTEREIFPLHAATGFNSIVAVHFAKDGIVFEMRKGKLEPLAYADIAKIDFSPGAFSHADLYIHTREKRRSRFIEFFLTQASNDKVQSLRTALTTLAADAQGGHPFLCSDDPQDYSAALAEFKQQTAAWRELATKPPVSEEVYKDRLLAEDALKNRDLRGAAKFYETGIASDPSWAQGWYNAALVYAELNGQPAKDNIILWEAKTPHAAAAATLQAARKNSK